MEPLTQSSPINYSNLTVDTNLISHADSNITSNLDSTLLKTCRICLEDSSENEQELISPCLCKGGSKYVHRTCINTWRASSTNPDAFYKCMECQYQYKYQIRTPLLRNGNYLHIHCNPCQMYMAQNSLISSIFHFILFIIFGYVISFLDSNRSIYNSLKVNEDDTEFDIYFFLGEITYITFYLLIFICFFIGIRNRTSLCPIL